MKAEKEIRLKLLELYQSREKFSELVAEERKKSDELNTAFRDAELAYSEKISMLEWVLNSDSDKICLPNDNPLVVESSIKLRKRIGL